MSQGIVFQHNTLKLPCRFEELQINESIDGYKIIRIISIDNQKSVFLLEPAAVLCVRHSDRKLPNDLINALHNGISGLATILKTGVINNHWYTIDQFIAPLPEWNSIGENQRLEYVRQMVHAINNLHNLGYCHLDIKTEHFGLDNNGTIRLIDFDSALPFLLPINEKSNIEYTSEYAAPEIFEGKFSTASDYYSLGKVLVEWGNVNPNALYLNWKRLVKQLLNSDYSARYSFNQMMQVFDGDLVDPNTGPRHYKEAVTVGNRRAYSDRQLAFLLTQNYHDAIAYTQRRMRNTRGNTDSEKLARLIHTLDSSLPLWWKGKAYSSTQDIARDFSTRLPQKNISMQELLQSGILLEFDSITNTDVSLVRLLQNAKQYPDRYYWEVSRAFGGNSPVEETAALSITNLSAKVTELNSLVLSRIQHGDPVMVASILERIDAYPNSQTIDSVITQIRAIQMDNASSNLTNIDIHKPFGKYIETRLPEPGHHSNSATINDLFSRDTLYLISQVAFDQWKTSNQTQKELRHQRNVSIGKAIGWTALGIGFLAILPYILAGLAIIAIIVIILSIL